MALAGWRIDLTSLVSYKRRLSFMISPDSDGRCDAILLAADPSFRPPEDGQVLAAFRKQVLGLGPLPDEVGPFDLVACRWWSGWLHPPQSRALGSGLEGCTYSGSSCARRQQQFRNSSQAVGRRRESPALSGTLGVVVAELDSARRGFAQKPAATYDDEKKPRRGPCGEEQPTIREHARLRTRKGGQQDQRGNGARHHFQPRDAPPRTVICRLHRRR